MNISYLFLLNNAQNLTITRFREMSLSERDAIKHLREAGLSYAKIARTVECSKLAAFKVQTFGKT